MVGGAVVCSLRLLVRGASDGVVGVVWAYGSQSLLVDLLDWDAIVCVIEWPTDMRRKVVVGLWVQLIDSQRH